MERAVQYVRGSFFAGEQFAGLAGAQAAAEAWCRDTAGLRIHGTIAAGRRRCSLGTRPGRCSR